MFERTCHFRKKEYLCTQKHRGVEQWQLVRLITWRSLVRILPPQPIKKRHFWRFFFFLHQGPLFADQGIKAAVYLL